MTVEQLGAFGEAIWRWVLECSGWEYIALTSIAEGGAPMMHGGKDKTILPDLDACNGGRAVYVECKAKWQSIVLRKRNQERHGINARNFSHYNRIAMAQGKKCAIGLVELNREGAKGALSWSGSLLFETLNNLGEPEPEERREQPPKVYWPRKKFSDLDSLTPLELYRLGRRQLRKSYADELDKILFPFNQQDLF